MSPEGVWIAVTGSLVALNCALLGTFLYLRKMSMLGDAISHAVLPGIVLAYMVAETRSSLPILIGAAITGVLATLIIEWLSKRIGIQNDASIGITFTALFAIGVILITSVTGSVDLDQDCVLYGEIAYVPLDTVAMIGADVPRVALLQGSLLILVLALLRIGFKPLLITTFDPSYAQAIGIPVQGWHYTLMCFTSLATVFSFEAVGAILVVAFLVIPPATAFLITRRLTTMLGLSAIFGILSAWGGYFLAVWIDGSISPAMAVVSATVFALVLMGVRLNASRKRSRLRVDISTSNTTELP